MRLVDDTAARRDRRLETRLDALCARQTRRCASRGAMAWPGRAPASRPSIRVQGGRPHCRWPSGCSRGRRAKTDVNRIAFRRDGHLHFLDGRTIGDRTVLPAQLPKRRARAGRAVVRDSRCRGSAGRSREYLRELAAPPHPQSLVPSQPPRPSAPPRSATRHERQRSRRRATRPSHQRPRRRGNHANPPRSCSSSRSSGDRPPIGLRSHVIARRTKELSGPARRARAPILPRGAAASPGPISPAATMAPATLQFLRNDRRETSSCMLGKLHAMRGMRSDGRSIPEPW